ncbi:hypothetical protein ACWD6P_14870 [Streptomyces sp. NPDC002446]
MTARAGAVRWAGGVVLALLAALAVLIHHETAAITASPPRSAAHAGHAMPAMGHPSPAPHAAAADHTDLHGTPAPAHGADGSACTDPGMQHCTTASVEVFQLDVPSQGHAAQPADPYRAGPGALPAGTVSRAPPDLSVLSRLRI